MRALIQRVRHGEVIVDEDSVARIGSGLVVLLGVGHGDGEAQARYLAEKIAHLRIFEEDQGKTNLSVVDVGGSALVVSQFTLYADTRKGRRPSFTDAAPPELASQLVRRFSELLKEQNVPTQEGVFGASMQVNILNDGPMTIWMEKD